MKTTSELTQMCCEQVGVDISDVEVLDSLHMCRNSAYKDPINNEIFMCRNSGYKDPICLGKTYHIAS